MRTSISDDNPFSYDRWAFAWEKVPTTNNCHLDFGCGDGNFLNALARKRIGRLVGVDTSSDMIKKGKLSFPEFEFHHVPQNNSLPFDDGIFDSITLMDVLEHIHQQESLLEELARVLRNEGILIVTVPQRHIFSFMDLGNFKFLFPRLHRWVYLLRHTYGEYEQRYVTNPDGLIGDISNEKRWHEHFSRKHIKALIGKSGFEIIEFDGSGLLGRLIIPFISLSKWFRPLNRLLRALYRWDSRHFQSMNLFCVANKKAK